MSYKKIDSRMCYYDMKKKALEEIKRDDPERLKDVEYVSQCWKVLYESGTTPREIGKIFSVNGRWVNKVLTRMGVKMRPHGGRRNHLNFSRDMIIAIRDSTEHPCKVANKYGCSRQTIKNIQTGRTWADIR